MPEAHIRDLLRERILILDGAMGTMIQRYKLDEAAFRGERFKDWTKDLKGHNDLLNLTQPAIIEEIHRQYFEAGADIVETNTFNSQSVSLADYGMDVLGLRAVQSRGRMRPAGRGAGVWRNSQADVALSPARSARRPRPPRCRRIRMTRRRAARPIDELVRAYSDQVRGLLDGGVDLLLVETIFDTLNAKAAFFAIQQRLRPKERGRCRSWLP